MIEMDLGRGLKTKESDSRFLVQGSTVEAVHALTYLVRKGAEALYVKFKLKKEDWPNYSVKQLSDGKVFMVEFYK